MRLAPGDRLGAHEILELLGTGGMGEVYRARDTRLLREVAIKILAPELASDPEALARFVQEARAAAALNHPNIIAVHDVGADSGFPYIVTELLRGETLRQRLARGALGAPLALDYAEQIARGLAAAHEVGIVHRDVKPENVFITAGGQVKVLDFGLARLATAPATSPTDETHAATSPTRVGTVLGTAGYMSPEQVRAEAVDHRSDIFSFGAVLYEMLEGRRAFRGASAIEAMSAVLRDEPAASTAPVDSAAAHLERIVRRCLAKRPEDRFQSARDLAFALGHEGGAAAPARPRFGRQRFVAMTAAAVAIAAVAWGAWAYFGARPTAADPPRISALVVLPMRNLSNDPAQEYFTDGMTEALITQLGRVGGLSVISRTSAMTFKGATVRLPEIARQLRVDAAVEGAVMREGDRVRITVQLIHPASDTNLWTNSYEGDLGDVFGLQARVARAIAEEIKVRLTPQEEARLAETSPVNRQAHEQYLHGRFFLAKGTAQSIAKALEAFNAAIKIDPRHARAYAGIADAYTLLRSTYAPPHAVMPKAKAAALQALSLDPDLAEAHVSLAGVLMFYEFDWKEAERSLARAIELSPNLADAHDYYALYFAALGRHEDARRESRRALELDPLSLMFMVDAGWVHYLARDYQRTIEMDRKALDLDPNFWPALRDLGLAYEKVGRFPEAIAALEKARSLDSNPSILEMLGSAYAAWGKKAEAQKVLAELTASASRSYVCPYEVATVHAALGDRKATMEWLDKGFQERADCMPWVLSDPKLEALHGTPGFKDLLTRLNFRH